MSTRTVGVDIDGKYGGDFLIFIRRVTVTVTVHSISQVDDGPLPFVAAAAASQVDDFNFGPVRSA